MARRRRITRGLGVRISQDAAVQVGVCARLGKGASGWLRRGSPVNTSVGIQLPSVRRGCCAATRYRPCRAGRRPSSGHPGGRDRGGQRALRGRADADHTVAQRKQIPTDQEQIVRIVVDNGMKGAIQLRTPPPLTRSERACRSWRCQHLAHAARAFARQTVLPGSWPCRGSMRQHAEGGTVR